MKRVVLVRTLGPRNAGMVARAVANFGPAELVFVAPVRPSLLVHPEFEQMSHGVENLGERIRVVATLAEALADCTRTVGFTARARGARDRKDWRGFRDVTAGWLREGEQRVALVFGSEENGLTIPETDACQELCFLPTSREHTSINLAMSVGIVLCSLYEEHGRHQNEAGARLIDAQALAFLKEHLKHVLGGQIARGEAARRDIEGAVERLFSRAPIEGRDARAWHMMMRALGSERRPEDFGIGGTEKSVRRTQALDRARRRASPAPPHEGPSPPVEGSGEDGGGAAGETD